MSDATSNRETLDTACMILGTVMRLIWAFWIGFVGFALLMAIAHAMLAGKHTMVIICTFLLFTPVMMTVLWGIVMAANMLRKKLLLTLAIPGPSGWERRQEHRILYQAYFL